MRVGGHSLDNVECLQKFLSDPFESIEPVRRCRKPKYEIVDWCVQSAHSRWSHKIVQSLNHFFWMNLGGTIESVKLVLDQDMQIDTGVYNEQLDVEHTISKM